jgi:hypothetical protein
VLLRMAYAAAKASSLAGLTRPATQPVTAYPSEPIAYEPVSANAVVRESSSDATRCCITVVQYVPNNPVYRRPLDEAGRGWVLHQLRRSVGTGGAATLRAS